MPHLVKLLTGGAVFAAAAPNITFQPLQLVLELLAALVGLAGLATGVVALYKARSDKELSSVQAMSLLFERQREVNADLVSQREAEIETLKTQLKECAGDRTSLRRRLAACQRDKKLLENQIVGLDRTIADLRDELEH